MAPCNTSTTSVNFNLLYLSLKSFITHLVAKIIFFCQLIAKGTPSTLPPILKGNNNTLGVILTNEKKKTRFGSNFSFNFN
jgi:hypothetical protein